MYVLTLLTCRVLILVLDLYDYYILNPHLRLQIHNLYSVGYNDHHVIRGSLSLCLISSFGVKNN